MSALQNVVKVSVSGRAFRSGASRLGLAMAGVALAVAAPGLSQTLDLGGATVARPDFDQSPGSPYAVVQNGTLQLNNVAPLTFAGVLQDGPTTGNIFSLQKFGNSTLTLTGTSTYRGETLINTGTLKAGAANVFSANSVVNNQGGNLDLGGFNQTVGGLRSAGTVISTGGSAATLTLNVASGTVGNLFGTRINETAGVITVVKTGAGEQDQSFASTYTGGTILNAGTLGIGNSAAIGTGALTFAGPAALSILAPGITVANNIVLNSNGTINRSGDQSTLAGVISGTGALTYSPGGFVLVTGTNSYSGGTSINGGVFTVGSDFALGVGNVTIGGVTQFGSQGSHTIGNGFLLNSQLRFQLPSAPSVLTLVGALSGTGGIWVQSGNGTLVLDADSTYTGGTILSSGNTTVGTNGALSTGGILVAGNATLTAGGAGLVTANNFNLGAQLTVDSNGTTYTLPGAISDGGVAGSLRKVGAGTLVLSGANSYSGGTRIEAGAVSVGSDGQLGTVAGALTLAGGTLQVTGTASETTPRPVALTDSGGTVQIVSAANNLTLTGAVSGTGVLSKTGAGTLTLAGSNTSSGGTSVTAGTLAVGSAGALGAGGLTVSNANLRSAAGGLSFANGVNVANAVVDVQTFDLALSGPITGSNFTKIGGGTLTLSGANSFNAGVTVSQGALALGSNAALGTNTAGLLSGTTLRAAADGLTIANNIIVQGGAPVTLDTQAFNLTLSGTVGTITSPVTINKIGAGRLTIAGTVAADPGLDALNVNAGELRLNGTFTGNALNVAAGGTLSGSGSAGGTTTIANGATLSPGTATPGTLNLNNLVLNSGSTLNFKLGQAGVVGGANNDLVTVNNQLTLAGTLNVFNQLGFSQGNYTLFTYGSLVNNGLTIGTLPSGFAGVVAVGGGTVRLQTTGNLVQYWDGNGAIADGVVSGGAGNWTSGNLNWTNAAGTVNSNWGSQSAIFGTTGGLVTVTGPQAFTNLTFTVGGYTLAGDVLTANAPATIDTQAGATVINNVIAGSAGLTKSSGGTLTLNGASTYTGGTSINGGQVNVGNGSALGSGAVALADGTTLGAAASIVLPNAITLAGSDRIDNRGFALLLTGPISGSGSVTFADTAATPYDGFITLASGNTYTGGTTIDTVRVGTAADSALGAAAAPLTLTSGVLSTSASFAMARGITLNGFGQFLPDLGTTLTLNGPISGPGGLDMGGLGTLVLTGNNSQSQTIVSSGILSVGSDANLGAANGPIGLGNATLRLTSSFLTSRNLILQGAGVIDTGAFTDTFNGVVSNVGSLTKVGSGNLILNGSNSFAGGLGISAGTVTLGSNTAAGVGGISLTGGTTLAAGVSGLVIGNAVSTAGAGTLDSGAGTFTLANSILGPGSITKAGTGNLVLNGLNSFTNLGVSAGSVTLGTNTSAGVGGISLADGTTLAAGVSGLVLTNAVSTAGAGTVDSGAGTFTLANSIVGPGSITKAGTGNLVLNGNNSFTNLGIKAGTVTVGSSTAAGNGGISLADGTTLAAGVSGLVLTNAVSTAGAGTVDSGAGTFTLANSIVGPGSITKAGSGNLVLNGNNSFTNLGIKAGTVTVGTSTAAGNGGISLADGTTLAAGVSGLVLTNAISTAGAGTVDSGAGTFTLANSIVGAGSITKAGSGNLVLNGANSFTNLGIKAGTVTVGTSTAAGNGGISLADGTTLAAGTSGLVLTNAISTAGAGTVDSGAGTLTLANSIAGPGSITKAGSGNLVLNGNNSFTNLGIKAGTVTVGTNTAAGNGGISLADGTTLAAGTSGLVLTNALSTAGAGTVDSGAGTFTLANSIAGPGSITKAGSGNLVLNGANSFANLGIKAGTVTVGTNTAAGNGGISLADGTTLAAGTSGLVLTNAVSTAGAGTINGGAGVFTLAGPIAGPGSITSSGTGNVVLNGNNSFTNLGIKAGTVTVGTSTAAGNGGISLADGTTLAAGTSGLVLTNAVSTAGAGTVDSGAGTFTLANTIVGSGSITKSGTGNLVLNGANSFTNLGIKAGTVTLGTNTSAGVGGISLADGTALAAGTSGLLLANAVSTAGAGTVDSGAGTFTLANSIVGPGSITKAGAGNLVLNGANSFTNLGIKAGTVTVGTNTSAGNGGISLAGGTTLAAGVSGLVLTNAVSTAGAGTVDSGTGTFTLANSIVGPGSITKAGAGNLVLNGSNTYSGTTAVSQGTLTVNGANSGGGATLVSSGATLTGSGSIAGTTTIADGATIAPGNGVGTLTLGGLILGNNANLNFQLGQANVVGGAFNDLLQVNGNLTLGGKLSVTDSNAFAFGVYRLINYTGGLTNNGLTVSNLPGAFSGTVQTNAPGAINLIVTAPGVAIQYWDGADQTGNGVINGGNGTWNATNTNWTTAAPSTINSSWQNGVAVFSGAAGTVNVVGTQAFQGLQFVTPGYVLTGGALSTAVPAFISTNGGTTQIDSVIAGSGSITKQGAGNLILNGANTFNNLGISAGTVTLGTNTSAGIGGISLADGTTLAAGVSGLVVGNAVSTAGAGTIDSGAGTFTLANSVLGPGSITKAGSGNLVLNGANSFSNLGIKAGTVTVGTNTSAGVGGISLADGTTLAAGTSGLVLTNAISTAGAGTINGGAGTFTLAGPIAGPGSITSSGTGNLVLNGNNSFTNLGIKSGTVTVGTSTSAGNGGISLADGTTLAAGTSGLVLTSAISTAGAGTINGGAGVFTLAGPIAGPGSITSSGTGNLVLNGNNSFTNLGIKSGTVTVGTNTAAGSGGISMADGTTLAAGISGLTLANTISTAGAGTVNSGNGSLTLAGPIAGPGSITKTGAGILVLNGVNSFTNLGVSAGTVLLGNSNAAGNGGISLAGGTTLAAFTSGLVFTNAVSTAGAATINGGLGTITFAGPIAGPGSITKVGGGNLVLNGANSFTNLGVSLGTVTVGSNTAAGNGGISLADGTTLAAGTSGLVLTNAISTAGAGTINGGAGVFTLAGPIAGPGSITSSGTGNLVLNGANSFTNLGIKSGTVTVGTSTAAGNGGISLADGTTLAAGTSGLVLTNAVSTAGAGTVNGGTGTFTLAGPIAGPGSITSSGTGNLVLNGNNSFTNLGIKSGTVTVGTNTAAGSGGISMADGTTLAAGTSGLVLTNAISTAGAGTINGGAGVFTLAGPIAGPGSITSSGTGNLVLNGANSFTNLGIKAGTVTVGTSTAAGNGGISLADGTTLAAGTSGLVLTNAISTAGAGTINGGAGVFTLAGPIAGPGSITSSGTGNLVLNGANSFTNLGIKAGTVTVGTNTAAGNGGISLADGTTLAAGVSGLVLTNAISTAGAGTINGGAGVFTLAGPIAGPGSITSSGTGNLVLNGANSFTNLGIKAGTVTVGTSTAVGNGGISLADGTTLAAGTSALVLTNAISTAGAGTINGGAGVFTLAGPIAGPGSITSSGTGNLVLNGNNSFTNLGIKAGTVTVGTSTAVGNGGISLADGTTLAAGTSALVLTNAISTAGAGTINGGAGVFTLAGPIAGPGSITSSGTGNLVLNGNNSFTNLGIKSGTVTVGTSTAAGNGGISLADGTTLAAGTSGLVLTNAISTAGAGTINGGAGVFTLAGPIAGPGSITSSGTGNLVLNGANSFTNLGIKAGTVTVGTNTAAGNGGISLADGTTLAAGVSGLVLTNAISTAGAGTINGGAGVFTLAGPIAGPGSITSSGTGNLVLNGANSFRDLGVKAGTVTVGTNTSAGIGGISLADGTTLAAGTSGLVLTNAISTAGAGTINGGAGVFTLASPIAGPGSITSSGTGNLVLNGANSFRDLGVKAGTVTLGTNTSAGVGGISLANGTTLAAGTSGLALTSAISTAGAGTINGGAGVFTLAGPIAGPGSITSSGTGNLVLNGANSFRDLGVKAGTVTLGTNTSAGVGGISLADGSTLAAGGSGLVIGNAISTAGAGTFDSGVYDITLSGGIAGPGSITKRGTGGLTLAGIGSYAGATTVANGRLIVTGSLVSSTVTVASGATFAGTGSIAGLVVGSGATVAPGTAAGTIGTLTVTGNAVFQPGATYAVDVNPTAADRLTIGGTAALAGTLALTTASGSYAPITNYTILSAAGGRSGTFGTVTVSNAAFNPTVSYTTSSVLLSLAPKSLVTQIGGAAVTRNELNVATAFDAATASGFNPAGFAALFAPGLNVPAALNQLTGEIHSVERRVAMDDTRYVREAALDRIGEGLSSIVGNRDGATTTEAGGHSYTLWARGIGSWGSTDGDGNGSGFHTSSGGVIAGAELAFNGGKIGVFGNYISTDIDHFALGKSKVESTGGGVYAGYRQDHGLAAAVGASVSGIKARSARAITVPGLEQSLTARSDGNTYQAFVDVSYDLAKVSGIRVEPFARFAWVALDTAAFSETGGIAAVTARRGAYNTDVTTAGLRGSLAMSSLGGFALKASLGAQYTGGDRYPESLLSLAGANSFASITPAPVDKWALAGEASAEFRLAPTATLAIGYSGVNGKRTRDNGVRGTLTFGF